MKIPVFETSPASILARSNVGSSKFILSSNDFQEGLSNHERYRLWNDIHRAEIAALDYTMSDSLPFQAKISMMAFGNVALGETSGSIRMVERTKQNIGADQGSGHSMFINNGPGSLGGAHLGIEFQLSPGAAILISNTEPVSLFGGDKNAWLCLVAPLGLSIGAIRLPSELLARPVDAQNEALVLLKRYSHFLYASAPPASPSLMSHAADTILDLMCLGAGLNRDEAESDKPRGLRAARLAVIEAKIDTRFAEPGFSASALARETGLSQRYVYDLLQETGLGLSERIMELRLAKSRAMLADPLSAHMRISDIALSCGFGDISYFNRNFRRRFGCTPTAAR